MNACAFTELRGFSMQVFCTSIILSAVVLVIRAMNPVIRVINVGLAMISSSLSVNFICFFRSSSAHHSILEDNLMQVGTRKKTLIIKIIPNIACDLAQLEIYSFFVLSAQANTFPLWHIAWRQMKDFHGYLCKG